MENIGKEFKIKASIDELNSIGLFDIENIIDQKCILKEENANGNCLVEVKMKFDFNEDIKTTNFYIKKYFLCLIE